MGGPVVRIWRSHCWDQVQSLAREIRPHRLHGVAKKKKKKKNFNDKALIYQLT